MEGIHVGLCQAEASQVEEINMRVDNVLDSLRDTWGGCEEKLR